MAESIEALKARARVLHTRLKASDAAATARARTLPELRDVTDDAMPTTAKRRHCLAIVARELGFAGWPHAVTVLGGGNADDFGTLLYPDGAAAHWNIWSASYDEAKTIRDEHGGYLLAYKRHFFIVDRHFIETIGLDPDDPDWEKIGRDWARPKDPAARGRLYARLLGA